MRFVATHKKSKAVAMVWPLEEMGSLQDYDYSFLYTPGDGGFRAAEVAMEHLQQSANRE
jgi:hypothetical protein